MRVTPLLCHQCGTWFQPKTRRLNKMCSNACKQQSYRGIKKRGILLDPKEHQEELFDILQNANEDIAASPEQCLESLMLNNYEVYCDIVFKWGVDKFDKTADEWLKSIIQNRGDKPN